MSAAGEERRTGAEGTATLRVGPGATQVIARHIGYAADSARVILAAGQEASLAFELRAAPAAIAPIIISATRSERRVEDEPLRVEVLSGEDVGEKTQMHPADLRQLLSEMSGVHVQATPSSLGAASAQVQGLRGRYTMILTDGLPLYGAQAGSFGLLQIPPLDLRQAEVIKGAASALYGPGALGGVLNLVSRRPPDSSEAILDQTARGGSDGVAYLARELPGRIGLTTVAGAHLQRHGDVDGDGWADIPGLRRIELRPRLFRQDSAGGTTMATLGIFAEERSGGSMDEAGTAAFPERLTTRHADVGATMRRALANGVTVASRLAANVQARERHFGLQREREQTSAAFGEVSASVPAGAHSLLAGAALQLERYRNADVSRFDEDRSTPALFVQHTWQPSALLSTQLNARCDASRRYGTVCAPRVSLLLRPGGAVDVRLSGGGGWTTPSALTDETEAIGLTRVAGPLRVAPERSRSVSLDVSSHRGPVEMSATVFASRIADPVGLRRLTSDTGSAVTFVNAAGPSMAHGAEAFFVYNEEPVIVTAFYAATRTRETSAESGAIRETPMIPRESAGLDVAWDEDESGTRVGIEAFYTGPMALDDNPYRAVSPAYSTVGLLVSQRIGNAMLYVNLENLTNVRQSRFDPILRASPGEGGRRTVDAWGPLEGRAVNAGLRWRL